MVQPGDTILVKGGTYRERVTFKTSGKPGQRITLKAAPGERVVINGASPITGWRKVTREETRGNVNFPKIYCAEVADGPRALFQSGRRLKVSRWPVEGRLPTEGGRNNSVVDAKHLTSPPVSGKAARWSSVSQRSAATAGQPSPATTSRSTSW